MVTSETLKLGDWVRILEPIVYQGYGQIIYIAQETVDEEYLKEYPYCVAVALDRPFRETYREEKETIFLEKVIFARTEVVPMTPTREEESEWLLHYLLK